MKYALLAASFFVCATLIAATPQHSTSMRHIRSVATNFDSVHNTPVFDFENLANFESSKLHAILSSESAEEIKAEYAVLKLCERRQILTQQLLKTQSSLSTPLWIATEAGALALWLSLNENQNRPLIMRYFDLAMFERLISGMAMWLFPQLRGGFIEMFQWVTLLPLNTAFYLSNYLNHLLVFVTRFHISNYFSAVKADDAFTLEASEVHGMVRATIRTRQKYQETVKAFLYEVIEAASGETVAAQPFELPNAIVLTTKA